MKNEKKKEEKNTFSFKQKGTKEHYLFKQKTSEFLE